MAATDQSGRNPCTVDASRQLTLIIADDGRGLGAPNADIRSVPPGPSFKHYIATAHSRHHRIGRSGVSSAGSTDGEMRVFPLTDRGREGITGRLVG